MGHPQSVETPTVRAARRASSTEVQKNWREYMVEARDRGAVAVTVHGDVEVVVVSVREIERMDREISELRATVGRLTAENSPVQALRERFLDRLRSRDAASFNASVDRMTSTPVRLGGRLKVGDRF